jgi:LCP family protein required for cell wall assembly
VSRRSFPLIDTAAVSPHERDEPGPWSGHLDQALNGKSCDYCGGALAESDAFCGRCGNAIAYAHQGAENLNSTPSDQIVGRRLSGAVRLAPIPTDSDARAQNGHSTTDYVATTIPSAPKPKHRKRRRRSRPWYRRPLIVAPLVALIILGIGAGIILQQLGSTVSTVQTVSTPPPQVEVALDEEDLIAAGGDAASEPIPRVQIDTAPAVAAVNDAKGSGNGGYDADQQAGLIGTVRSKASNVADLSRSAAVAAGVGTDSAPALTILVMGVDARPGEAIDMGVRPDVLMVVRLDPATRSCRLLSIPRDTRTELPGYGQTKINHALMVGGIPYQLLVTEHLLGIDIDRYALIDFAGFKDLIDKVGDIEVTVPASLEAQGIKVVRGRQTFDGEKALAFARYRDTPTQGDFGRIKRQWLVLRAVGQKLSGRDALSEVRQLLPAVEDHMRTDLSATDFAEIANGYAGHCTMDSVQPAVLEGNGALLNDPLFDFPLYYIVVEDATIKERVAALMYS